MADKIAAVAMVVLTSTSSLLVSSIHTVTSATVAVDHDPQTPARTAAVIVDPHEG